MQLPFGVHFLANHHNPDSSFHLSSLPCHSPCLAFHSVFVQKGEGLPLTSTKAWHQVSISVSISFCIKTEQGNSIRETLFQNASKTLETSPIPTVRCHSSRPNYTTVTYLYKPRSVPSRLSGYWSKSLWAPMSLGQLSLCVFLWCFWLFRLLQSVFFPFPRIPWAQSHAWLWILTSVYFSYENCLMTMVVVLKL